MIGDRAIVPRVWRIGRYTGSETDDQKAFAWKLINKALKNPKKAEILLFFTDLHDLQQLSEKQGLTEFDYVQFRMPMWLSDDLKSLTDKLDVAYPREWKGQARYTIESIFLKYVQKEGKCDFNTETGNWEDRLPAQELEDE